jgi:hypothetical protein
MDEGRFLLMVAKMKKRGQEEMVGFVLIIVLVAVVFLVFMGIFLRRGVGGEDNESQEVYQFLDSMMEYTTGCAVSFEPAYLDFGELIRECGKGSLCLNGDTACEVLEEDGVNLLESAWFVSQEGNVKGYEFSSVSGGGEDESEEVIIEIMKGNCTGRIKGSDYLNYGGIRTELRICY